MWHIKFLLTSVLYTNLLAFALFKYCLWVVTCQLQGILYLKTLACVCAKVINPNRYLNVKRARKKEKEKCSSTAKGYKENTKKKLILAIKWPLKIVHELNRYHYLASNFFKNAIFRPSNWLMKNTCTKYVCAHSTEFFVLVFHFCTQLFVMEALPCLGFLGIHSGDGDILTLGAASKLQQWLPERYTAIPVKYLRLLK